MDREITLDEAGAGRTPQHVRAAPTHADPSGYYARLAVERPLYREEATGVWVAASAAVVSAVLSSEICYTRPVAGPVPEAIRGTPIAEIFGRLVRMRDDASRCPFKKSMGTVFHDLDPDRVAHLARAAAAALVPAIEPQRDGVRLTQFMSTLPVHVIAGLVGVPRERFGDMAQWVGDYGAATAAAVTGVPAVSPALIEVGAKSSSKLLALFKTLLAASTEHDDTLLAKLARAARRAGVFDEAAVIANGIGFMVQGFAATASTIGLGLLALARHPEARAEIEADPRLLHDFIQEVLRRETSTHSTLRFVTRDGIVAGQEMRAGDTIIVALAAANRDPALNRNPNRFDLHRKDRRSFEFSAGRHACPGDRLATQIAEIAVEQLLKCGVALDRLEASVAYRPSAHVRIPFFRQ